MSPTDRHQINDMGSGFNNSIRVTPITIAATSREELPGIGISNQLHRRKNVVVQNTSSGTIYVGDLSVGHSGDSATCSGIRLDAGDMLSLDAGRVRIYAYNEEVSEANIKLLEIS